ncbi:DUF1090 domain-containing protein [Nocardioides sp. GY 10127]|uniref:beta strand repeat-containing protein n=1 Tax=Nocardioides sp. GY 10127 TaxID=2569762 RepID=UPI0010A7B5B6|nr:DUF1090 domain-containing protein [Nocardioides sp. GY 10127]TIC81662.1 DUF1090 domain-containing protein [Nocardioides sp. GY 10127]
MNSSGIKRGLAVSAISALAVAGVPFIASPASAASGDSLTFTSAGPVRNGGSVGAKISFKYTGDVTDGTFMVIGSDLTSDADTPTQTIGTPGAVTVDPATKTGYVFVPVTTSADGASYSFAIYEDEGTAGVQANEARMVVSGTTSGVPASVVISPDTQTAPAGTYTDDYTVTLKDSSGRVTQLDDDGSLTPEELDISSDVNVVLSEDTFVADDMPVGTATFQAKSLTSGSHTLTAETAYLDTDVSDTALLNVLAAASGIDESMVDFVTGADNWDGYGDGTFTGPGGGVLVRSDQTSIQLAIKSPANAGKTVSLTADGGLNDVTFGGAQTKTYVTTLDANGMGTITITPDAASIDDGSTIDLDGAGISTTVTFEDVAVTEAEANATTYISAYGGTVSPTVTVLDQFGDPVTGVYVTAERTGGANTGAVTSRMAVNAAGQVTFSLADTKATAASHVTDNLSFHVYAGMLGSSIADFPNVATIVYTADGNGEDFSLTVNGTDPSTPTYDPATVFAYPLADAEINGTYGAESIALAMSGGTSGSPVTVSVDGDALVLKSGDTSLSDGASEQSGSMGDSFTIVGTKVGTATVTVTSAGVTKTAVVTIKSAGDEDVARNVTLTAPAKAEAGDYATFTATVTDAFGNPIEGFEETDLNPIVTGAAEYVTDSDETDADGNVSIRVKIDSDATSSSMVGMSVTGDDLGNSNQFGAAADRELASSTTDDAVGLTESMDTATASVTDVVNIAELEQAVADAQAAVTVAENDLEAAKAERDVAKVTFQEAVAKVKRQKAAVTTAEHKLAKAKKTGNKMKIRRARRVLQRKENLLENAISQRKIAFKKLVAARIVVKNATATLESAQADLDAAQAALDEANAG